MEHRHSTRLDGKLFALLYKRGLPVASGHVINASQGGLFITTEYDDVAPNQPIEVELCYPGRPGRLKAYVVRKEKKGLAVELENTDRNLLEVARLLEWVREQQARQWCHVPVRRQA